MWNFEFWILHKICSDFLMFPFSWKKTYFSKLGLSLKKSEQMIFKIQHLNLDTLNIKSPNELPKTFSTKIYSNCKFLKQTCRFRSSSRRILTISLSVPVKRPRTVVILWGTKGHGSKGQDNSELKFMYHKVASSRPVYYSKVIGQRPKVTVHKDQISPS